MIRLRFSWMALQVTSSSRGLAAPWKTTQNPSRQYAAISVAIQAALNRRPCLGNLTYRHSGSSKTALAT